MPKVNSKSTRNSCEICSKLSIKTAERRHGVFIVSFQHISLLSLAFLLLNLNKQLLTCTLLSSAHTARKVSKYGVFSGPFSDLFTVSCRLITKSNRNFRILHCVKGVRIQSYSGLYFPAFGLNMERSEVSLRIQSECGKMWTRITQNTDTFYAVLLI